MNWRTLGLVSSIALAATTFSPEASAQSATPERNTSTEVRTVVSPSSASYWSRKAAERRLRRERGYHWPKGRGYYYGGWGYPDDGYPFGYGPWSYHKGYPYAGSPAARYYDPYYPPERRGR